MNRERRLAGRGGYEADLRFGIREFLAERLERQDVRWLDLCCGTGQALVDAETALSQSDRTERLKIVAVDLVAHQLAIGPTSPTIEFHEASLHAWQPNGTFDLITCVHGLHYLGDKLQAIVNAASWLKPDGVFQAHLDLANVRHRARRRFAPIVKRWLLDAGFSWHARFHRLACVGPRRLALPWIYVGADDKAGPNVTGQPAVDSWYDDAE
jgi:SAM-dependent methyltransferase